MHIIRLLRHGKGAYDYYDTGKGAGHAARHLYEAEGPAGRAAGR